MSVRSGETMLEIGVEQFVQFQLRQITGRARGYDPVSYTHLAPKHRVSGDNMEKGKINNLIQELSAQCPDLGSLQSFAGAGSNVLQMCIRDSRSAPHYAAGQPDLRIRGAQASTE